MDSALTRMRETLSLNRRVLVHPGIAGKQRVISVVVAIGKDAAKHACWDKGLAAAFHDVLAAVEQDCRPLASTTLQ
jgi:hypothetical protein